MDCDALNIANIVNLQSVKFNNRDAAAFTFVF